MTPVTRERLVRESSLPSANSQRSSAPRPPLPGPNDAWAFFLDVDGTLLEIAATPDGTTPRSDTTEILGRLRRAAGGALALVSGRPIGQIDRMFPQLRVAVAGLHGFEWRHADGSLHQSGRPSSDLETAIARLEDFAELHPGVIVEDKGMMVALHYRQAPDCASEARQLVAEVARALGDHYKVLEGKMVLEIKSIDAHKGMVVEHFLAEPPFAGRIPVFVGDDVTDEDAFAIVNRHGGYSIRVGPPDDASGARWSLPTVSQVHSWLGRVADALEQREPR